MNILSVLSVDDNFTENHFDAVYKSKIAQQRPSKRQILNTQSVILSFFKCAL